MKKPILFFLLVCITFAVQAQDWSTHKNIELAFTADFPGVPLKTTQDVPTAIGDITMHMLSVDTSTNLDASNALYAVAYSAYPEENFKDSTDESDNATLNGAVNGAVTNVNGKLLVNNDINLNGFPGKEGKIELNGAFIHLRVYLVENVLYFCQVICFAEKDDNTDINKFLDSFELINTKP